MKQVLFLGCGKMGSIIAQNLVTKKSFKATQITVLERPEAPKVPEFNYVYNLEDLPEDYQADLVFIAIKPQNSEEFLTEFAKNRILHKKTIFVSILAGKKLAFFEKSLGESAKIVRSMPNLPIKDAQGIFTYINNKNITKVESSKLAKIFSKFGSAPELKDEKLFDVMTALFGSGPAYIFLLQEVLTEIALKHNIEKDQAADLVKQLILGSVLMSCNSELDFTALRESVTSKNGTTAAALDVLQEGSALKNIFEKAIDAAVKKSQEISDNS